MHANCNQIKSDNVCAIIVIKLSEFVRLVRLSEIVGHEKESRAGQSDSRTCPTGPTKVGLGHQFIFSLHVLKSKVLTNIKEVCTK